MISAKMLDKLNDQMNKEAYSAYLYLAMKSYALAEGLKGIANWFDAQMTEELEHARKFYDYIDRRGGRIELPAIDKPPQKFSSVKDLFEKTLEHEKMVTGLIDECVKVAVEEKDRATQIFLQWFVTEQVEEEDNVSAILRKIELAGEKGPGLFMLDSELGKREYIPSAE